MILTLFQGHRCVRNITCKLCVSDSCPLWFKRHLVAIYIEKVMHSMVCVTDVYSREIIDLIFISQVSGLVKSFKLEFTQTP